MLHLHPQIRPEKKIKDLKRWLSQPECRDLVDYLIEKDAECTAIAGNKLVESKESEGERPEALEAASESVFYRKVIELIGKMRETDFTFETYEVQTKPATTTPEE